MTCFTILECIINNIIYFKLAAFQEAKTKANANPNHCHVWPKKNIKSQKRKKSNLLKPVSTPFAQIGCGSFAKIVKVLKQSDCTAC